jgi:putative oxidoreductase
MLGASTMVHQPQGFFMNWFGKQQGEGDEFMC